MPLSDAHDRQRNRLAEKRAQRSRQVAAGRSNLPRLASGPREGGPVMPPVTLAAALARVGMNQAPGLWESLWKQLQTPHAKGVMGLPMMQDWSEAQRRAWLRDAAARLAAARQMQAQARKRYDRRGGV